jgi:hypothetical protein
MRILLVSDPMGSHERGYCLYLVQWGATNKHIRTVMRRHLKYSFSVVCKRNTASITYCSKYSSTCQGEGFDVRGGGFVTRGGGLRDRGDGFIIQRGGFRVRGSGGVITRGRGSSVLTDL